MIILHDPKCGEYQAMGHPESPARVRRSAEYLKEKHPEWEWWMPEAAGEKAILRAHSGEHLKRLSEPADFDGDAPYFPGIDERARMSAGAALSSMQLAREGKWSFSSEPISKFPHAALLAILDGWPGAREGADVKHP